MILKGSQRGGAKQLGLHLLKTVENEHVEVHDVRGFMTDDVVGALREAEAVSKGTKCRQFLFSVSLNPPETESVRIETFEQAIAAIEEKNGLTDQPRVIVFHEKEGRRHCHAVWSRIDAETMTAKPLPFFKNKLMEVSKQLYLEHGWQMPRGLADNKNRDPRNFTLAEWQQAKRVGRHAGDLKADIQEAWAISDNSTSFSHALEERGLFLARGDRRGHVAVTYEGEVISIPRAIGKKSKDVTTRLGKSQELDNVSETRQRIAKDIAPKLGSYITKARADANAEKSTFEIQRREMQAQQQAERSKLDAGQKARAEQEVAARSARLRKGLRGLLDRVTGKRAALEKQNEMEAVWSLQRDREQRHALVDAQLKDRRSLQAEIVAARNRHAVVLRTLHHDRTNNRLIMRGLEPLAKKAFSRLKAGIDAADKVDLPANSVTDLGKQHRETLSRVFEARGTKGEEAPRAQNAKVESQSAKQAYIDRQKQMSVERVKTAQQRLEKLRQEQLRATTVRVRQTRQDAISSKDRLQRLREDQTRKPRGPELDI